MGSLANAIPVEDTSLDGEKKPLLEGGDIADGSLTESVDRCSSRNTFNRNTTSPMNASQTSSPTQSIRGGTNTTIVDMSPSLPPTLVDEISIQDEDLLRSDHCAEEPFTKMERWSMTFVLLVSILTCSILLPFIYLDIWT
jgi:hypothetical protein